MRIELFLANLLDFVIDIGVSCTALRFMTLSAD